MSLLVPSHPLLPAPCDAAEATGGAIETTGIDALAIKMSDDGNRAFCCVVAGACCG